MKLFIWLLSALLILSGCQTQPAKTLKILAPNGAPSIALIPLMDDYELETCNGQDLLVAKMSSKDSPYDVVVAPINIGQKLISENKTDYELKGVLTWGNLYIVGSQGALSSEGDLGLFGKGAVPEKVYTKANVKTSLKPIYQNNASDVASDLLNGKIKAGLLAEPLVSATIKKAQANNMDLEILYDFQQNGGYPQAAVFVKKGVDASSLYENLQKVSKKDVASALEKVDVKELGLPASDIVLESYDRQNIQFKLVADCQDVLDNEN